jgi:hypothetical protein
VKDEVRLRNSINHYFQKKISKDWFESNVLHTDTLHKINESKNKIKQRKEEIEYFTMRR